MSTVMVINRPQMGEGDEVLGQKLLGACLRKAANAIEDLSAIVLYNAGVKLAVRSSPLSADLRILHERGIEVLPCGTCLEHYGLTEQLVFDRASNMEEILTTLHQARKVITL